VAVKLGYRSVYREPEGLLKWKEMGMPVEGVSGRAVSGPEATTPGPLHGWAMLWTLLGIFLGGIALNLTPCVYPMIPITVSFFGGRSIRGDPGQARLFAHGLCYLFGLALTNSTLGVIAALTGGLMGAMLQSPVVLIAIAAILLLLAASLFDLWELRLPGAIMQAASKSHSGYLGSLFMGLTLGVVAAPCIGPFVLGLLTWVAGMGSPWLGFLVFFTLSLGLGLPLFVLALFSGQLQRLPQAGGWMIWVRRAMAWVLVGMAVYFIGPLLPRAWWIALIAGVAIAAGLHLGWIDRGQGSFRAFPWLRGVVGVGCLVLATFLITSHLLRGPGVDWKDYSEELLLAAKSRGKPVIIDFYATWCAPCRELEEITFHHGAVVQRSREGFVMIKVDVTRGGNPVHERLMEDYGVRGVPTIVFLDAEGKERQDLRLVDFLPPEHFLLLMEKLQGNLNRE
jgi:thioredoxin:protein disulfide reductase